MRKEEVRNYQIIYIEELRTLGKTDEEVLQIFDISQDVIKEVFNQLQIKEDKRKLDLIQQMKRRKFSNRQIAEELEMTYRDFVKFQNKGVTKKPVGKKVRCVETGEVFATAREAASKVGTRADCISHMLHGDQKTAGILNGVRLHWEFVE